MLSLAANSCKQQQQEQQQRQQRVRHNWQSTQGIQTSGSMTTFAVHEHQQQPPLLQHQP
jgi:DeoR/GlpR family transcriptional regulator of sugar metabolism